jgi:hypothetical protein
MEPADKIAMGSKISRTMLRRSRGLPQTDPTGLPRPNDEQMRHLLRGLTFMQNFLRKDADRFSSVVRVLHSRRDSGMKDVAGRTEVEMFADYVRGIVREELESSKKD